jgi:hypothetical protein
MLRARLIRTHGMSKRTVDESCALLDQIIGRCVRDADFGARVLADPETALAEYELQEDELDDFRALKEKHAKEAAESWAEARAAMDAARTKYRREHRGEG